MTIKEIFIFLVVLFYGGLGLFLIGGFLVHAWRRLWRTASTGVAKERQV